MLKLFPSTRQKYLNYREDVQHYYEVILIETELPDKALNIEIQSGSRYEDDPYDLIWPHLFSLSTESASRFLKVLNCSVGTNDFDDVPLNGQLFKPIFEKCFQGHLKRMLEFKYKGWFSIFSAVIIVV